MTTVKTKLLERFEFLYGNSFINKNVEQLQNETL